ncbi:MarR family transcriptional regulator [Ponticoccus sp. SC2-23]|uniref:MarR family winged helix-turn-helix transcriptional regulator n=1 Tax=Alexandriicola marinus TaxID=2081710 RepID=UPI000FD91DB6|nr:MarR family transcriptional regulator [Alexandriicola marinus]MBM1220434.1 MarR family transcriptional regulator [Ponticoccus sp. SC6-9]MBM1225120.1 MarR family transcriptional regulator [Ponticoccus sp. SC6-15]MBM1228634.1 MarR family transcriptional regulator [Ponticoccus sp. SC6-38]MBM1233729.1 MarR family transcriptional regulator [Ponticoccus sp. SC6-45]MBM1239135.1 MarR family transcriptional regulator [Ponticoccus sp. SC6-49]MBM1242917.1 MarR family transcriptional regulator [Pontic
MTQDTETRPKTAPPDFDLDGFLPYRLTVAADRLSAGLARRYREEFGLSVAEWRVLVHLVDSGSVSVRDIGQKVSLEKSKASRAASRLEADGLIEKGINAQDRRLLVLSLTDEGRALMAQLLPLAIAYQDRLEQLVGERLDALNEAIDIILKEDP